MENNNQSSSSPPPPSPPPPPPASSSLTTQLFDDNDSQSSSSGIFASVFPSPSTVARNSSCLHLSLDNQIWSAINGTSGVMNMDNNRSIFLERVEPCPLSSSIYYGGLEDMYIRSSSDLNSRSYTKFFMKHDLKDDPSNLQIATRGNWWEGSLYY